MSEMKPVIEWLKELPDGYRERAIAQYDGVVKKCYRDDAVGVFCIWQETKEGLTFWAEVSIAWESPGQYDYPPIPDDRGPGCKPKRDMRYVANVTRSCWYLLEKNTGDPVAESYNLYRDKRSAKRGLIRFLKRLGVDENAVRWEGSL